MKASVQSNQYWSVGQSARFLGVSTGTIRNLLGSGQLSGYVAQSGHRKVLAASVKAYASGTSTDDKEGIADRKVVGYARCSSLGQKESLTRQIARLTEHISKQYGIPTEGVEIRSEICSSFAGNRKAYFQLCDDIYSGKIAVCVSEFQNRFSRIPSQIRQMEDAADRHDCQLVFLDKEEQRSEMEQFTLELCDFLQHLSALTAGKKSALVTTVHLKEETLARIAELSNEGRNQKDIHRIIVEEGHTTEKGEKISMNKVRQIVLLNGKVKTVVGIDPANQTSLQSLLTQWVSENIVASQGSRLTMKEILPKFNNWMIANGKVAQRSTIIGKMLVKMGLPSKRVEGYRYFLNCTLA